MLRNRNSVVNTNAVLSQHTDSDHDSSFIKKKTRNAAAYDVYRLLQRRKVFLQCVAVGIFCLHCMMRTSDYYGSSTNNAMEKVRYLTDNKIVDRSMNDNPDAMIAKMLKKYPCHYMTERFHEFEVIRNYSNDTLHRSQHYHKGDQDISIATMIDPTDSMFQRLKIMAKRWSGPISVSVFNSDKTKTDQVKLAIDKYQARNMETFGSRISFHLVTDLIPARGKDKNVFPRNLLRNIAIENAAVEFILLLDVDLEPSSEAHEKLQHHLKELKDDGRKYALVVPAFERPDWSAWPEWKHFNDYKVSTKEDLLNLVQMDPEAIEPFLKYKKPAAHKATKSSFWMKTENRYPIKYRQDYEPYIVVRKGLDLPPFWEHFTGFGRNKLEWIEELHLAGYNFTVVPDVFAVHKQHAAYDIRIVRPFIGDEFVNRFQMYLKRKYGIFSRAIEDLQEWKEGIEATWEIKVEQEGIASEYTSIEKMAAMSKIRSDEFRVCIGKVDKTYGAGHLDKKDEMVDYDVWVNKMQEGVNVGDGGTYDQFYWKDLPPIAKEAAKKLAFDEVLWDKGRWSSVGGKKWHEMTTEEKKALEILGFLEKDWYQR